MSSEKCSLEPSDSSNVYYYLGLFFAVIVVSKFLRSVCRGLYGTFIAELLGHTVNWKKLGEWAVVTGGTDGIGKAYAKALAEKGFNIVLVSRTQKKLDAVADEIGSKYKVKVITVAIDITDGIQIYEKLRREIEGLDVGVLVNNVGMGYAYAEYLTKVVDCEKLIDDIIKANIVSCTRATMLVLPQMEEKKRGVILNISSLSALSPVPLLNVYSASKAFVMYFAKATNEEYKKKGVIVQSVLPGFVSTNMSKMRPSLTTCTPDAFVRWALKSVGVENQTYGYPFHKIQGYAQELMNQYLPESLVLAINHYVTNDIRRRYYKKYGLTDGPKKQSGKDK